MSGIEETVEFLESGPTEHYWNNFDNNKFKRENLLKLKKDCS